MLELQSFSTEGQPAHLRIDYWHDITRSALTAQLAEPLDRRSFCGRMTSLDLGELRMVELAASGSIVTRSRSHFGCSTQAIYLVRLVLSGTITMAQSGKEICLQPGDFTLVDTTRPYQMSFPEPSSVLILRVPRERILQYISRPDALVGVLMPGGSGLSGLASRHLRDLWSASQEFVTHGASPRMSEMTMQLLASAYSVIPQAKADRSHLATALRARIVEIIERRLSDPDLSPVDLATELRITPGYLHRVFSSESESVARYILRRRLEECARMLKDPLQAARSITSVAFGLGFNSPTHFCRVFRERYGASPSEYRQAAH